MVAFGDDYVSKMTLKYKKQDDTGNYKCQRHFMINVKCKECNKEICRLCIFDSKEELEHYYNHFDSINLNEPYDLKIENNEISKMSEDPFYSKFNKILLSYEQSVSKTVYETDSYFEINNFKTFYYEYLNNTLTKNYFYINEIKKDFDLKAKRIIESQIMNLSEKK